MLPATPVDQAVPLLAVVVTLLAWLSYPAVMLGVPLLILSAIVFPDESLRLLAYGVVLAGGFGGALASLRDPKGRAEESGESRALSTLPPDLRAVLVTVAAVFVLRWLPLESLRAGREVALLGFAVAIVIALGRTPFAVLVAVLTVFFTPGVPLRTLLLPATVWIVVAVARLFGMPRIRLSWPSSTLLALLMVFFAWSGVVARAFPYFLREAKPQRARVVVAHALAAGHSATYDVPDGTRSLVVSGANVAHLRRGALLGRIDPGAIPVRIGDAADWGYLRRDHFFGAHNPLPHDAAGKLRDYGYAAWVDGAGRMALPRGAVRIRVTADPSLPLDAALQVEGFE